MKSINKFKTILLSLSLLFLVGGCATYNDQTKATLAAAKSGNLDAALDNLEKKNSSEEKEILYHFEKGELLRMKGAYEQSRETFLQADQKISVWEDTAKTNPSKLLEGLGSVIVNDSMMTYDGRDYEKVLLSIRLALDHLALGEWDKARIEIKKMHERESVIADFRSAELIDAKNKAEEKKLSATSFKDLNGYPVETLTDPAVNQLKNAYESAFANYLAGFVYEALGDISLAAPGYRKAAEMKPNIPLIDQALAGLDARSSASRKSGLVDTLIVIETGEAPEIQSRTISIPIPTPKGLELTAMSWPVILADTASSQRPSAVMIDGIPTAFATLTEINPMARKALSNEMPGIIVRSSVRAISRAAAQYVIDQSTANAGKNAQLVGNLFSMAAKITTVATEVADTRIWRTLPGYFTIARIQLPAGVHSIGISTPTSGTKQQNFIVTPGRYAIVDARIYASSLYVVPVPPPSPEVPAVVLDPVTAH